MSNKFSDRKLLLQCLFFIGVVTVFSGLVQMVKPGFVLSLIGGELTAGGNHSFAIVGMFMVLFGALLIHALSTERQEPVAIFWCAIQKLGASIAVGLGVYNDLFSWVALTVAGFDLLSFVLMIVFWNGVRQYQMTINR